MVVLPVNVGGNHPAECHVPSSGRHRREETTRQEKATELGESEPGLGLYQP
jgi:hypothetical protein